MLPSSLRGAFALSLSLALSGLALAPTHASAQEDERQQARAAFERGVSAYAAEQWEEALAAFQEAYRIAPHPSVRVNMANSYLHLGRPVEALDHFERFVIEGGEEADRAQLREVRSQIRELRGKVGEVFFRIEPEGATVTIDGHTTRRAPILDAVKLAEGTHHVEVAFSGRPTVAREFQVDGGGRSEVRIDLSAEAEPAEAAPGDAAPTDTGTTEPADDLGDLVPEAVAEPEAEPTSEPVEDEPGFLAEVPMTAWIAGGASVALAVTAIVLGVSAVGANDDFDDAVALSQMRALTPAERADALDAADRADRLALTADILGVTAILAAGASVFFVLWQPDGDDGVALAPSVGPNGGSVTLRGRF